MRVALACGLTLIAVAVAVALSRSPLVLAGTNGIPASTVVAVTKGGVNTCQNGEAIPQGTTAVRLWMTGNIKPRVSVTVLANSELVSSGVQASGPLGKVTTVPITRVPRALRDAQLCFAVDPGVEEIDLIGGGAPHPAPGESTGKMRIEYLRPASGSWWSFAGSIARRMGLGRAPAGRWAFLIPLALMALAAMLASWTILRRLGRAADGAEGPAVGGGQHPARQSHPACPPLVHRLVRRLPFAGRVARALQRVPGPAWTCACVACLSAASWSLISPPFQVTDEPSHFSYTQILAQTGGLPSSHSEPFSPEEETALKDLNLREVRFNPAIGTISTETEQRRLQEDLDLPLSRVGQGAGVAAPQPPLYYALETIPYYLGSGGTLLDQLALMRLLSALMAGLTALFAFLFLREALPAVPWAWTVGGLCTALAPLVGFISGAVNPDAMLCAVSAALFYVLARAFRFGLTPRLAVAIGAVTAIGFLTKLNFVGLVPGIGLALVLLTRRAARTSRRSALGSLALALALGGCPVVVYVLVNLLSHHATLGLASRGVSQTGGHAGSLLDEAEYIWQSYLFRLPGMPNDFPGIVAIRQLWFDRLVGVYGWLDTYFPGWVYELALVPAGLLTALCVRELVRVRGSLRARAGELLSYTAIGAGLLALIGTDSYLEFPAVPGAYSEPRYLLPLAVLFAAALALAARGAGRRWGPAVGTLIVLLILAHDIFSQLLEIGRYYV